jgi:membrane protein
MIVLVQRSFAMTNDSDSSASEDTPEARSSRVPARAQRAAERGTAVYARGRLWIENQDPSSRKGATIGWVRRYQAADGQLYAVLLAAYLILTLLPAILVESSYIFKDPSAWSDRVEHRLGLTGATAALFHGVLVGSGEHKLSSVLIALIDLFFFGLGFGRVLQLVHARSWGLDLRKSVIADQGRYFAVLGALIVMSILFLVQTRALRGDPSWIGYVLDLAWLAVVLGFFVWAPYMLLHRRVPMRNIVPGAIFTVLSFIVLRLISSLLLTHWLNWYSKTYGAFGIVSAIFFWTIIFATIMVLAAALSPALAHRRDLMQGTAGSAPIQTGN